VNAELCVSQHVQRVGRQLLGRPAKTEGSEAPLPLPDLCVAALKLRRKGQDTDREHAGDGWVETGLGYHAAWHAERAAHLHPEFDRRISRAKVRGITMCTVPGSRAGRC
jgi:hypothetical protein